MNDLKSHGNQILIFFDKKAFMVHQVFNKKNDRVVRFGKDISEIRIVSTTKHSASVMMLGVVASNVERIPTVSFETGKIYKESRVLV